MLNADDFTFTQQLHDKEFPLEQELLQHPQVSSKILNVILTNESQDIRNSLVRVLVLYISNSLFPSTQFEIIKQRLQPRLDLVDALQNALSETVSQLNCAKYPMCQSNIHSTALPRLVIVGYCQDDPVSTRDKTRQDLILLQEFANYYSVLINADAIMQFVSNSSLILPFKVTELLYLLALTHLAKDSDVKIDKSTGHSINHLASMYNSKSLCDIQDTLYYVLCHSIKRDLSLLPTILGWR